MSSVDDGHLATLSKVGDGVVHDQLDAKEKRREEKRREENKQDIVMNW